MFFALVLALALALVLDNQYITNSDDYCLDCRWYFSILPNFFVSNDIYLGDIILIQNTNRVCEYSQSVCCYLGLWRGNASL